MSANSVSNRGRLTTADPSGRVRAVRTCRQPAPCGRTGTDPVRSPDIDGAGEFRVFARVIVPLVKPSIALRAGPKLVVPDAGSLVERHTARSLTTWAAIVVGVEVWSPCGCSVGGQAGDGADDVG